MKQEWQLTKGPRWAFTTWILAFGAALLAALVVANYYLKSGGPPWPTP
jgi:hypothetical protein